MLLGILMRKLEILAVDDDVRDCLLVKDAFLDIDVRDPIFTVHDGAEAIDYLKGNGRYADRNQFPFPTLLLLDLKMPGMNGFEFLAYVKKNPTLSVIPTIVFTSSSDLDDIKNAYLLGANAYIVKGRTFDEICSQLKFIYGFWMRVQVPPIDREGHLLLTHHREKPGEKVAG